MFGPDIVLIKADPDVLRVDLHEFFLDQHASCGRKIEDINAGTEAYTIDNNLERMRRDILPLKPDLILSTHGMNGFYPFGLRRVPEPNEPGVTVTRVLCRRLEVSSGDAD